MPHLDAKALTSDDRQGLEFLASVLDVPAQHPEPDWKLGVALSQRQVVASRVAPRRRRAKAQAIEPA